MCPYVEVRNEIFDIQNKAGVVRIDFDFYYKKDEEGEYEVQTVDKICVYTKEDVETRGCGRIVNLCAPYHSDFGLLSAIFDFLEWFDFEKEAILHEAGERETYEEARADAAREGN